LRTAIPGQIDASNLVERYVIAQPQVRRALPEDCELLTSIITLAFANDPLWSRALAVDDGRTDHHARFWQIFIEGALRYPWAWVTDGGEACSTWIPPGCAEMSEEQEDQLAKLANETLGSAADDFLELMTRFESAHPRDEPHYYLSLVGTHPEHRGMGIGMALLEQNLALIDAAGYPAYLESSNPSNNRRYAGVGFEAVGKFSYPGGGPAVTTMWRPAR
jgi:GNAT superfamily N-acetyltransferase